LIGSAQIDGNDELGAFHATLCNWTAGSRIQTTVKQYHSSAVVFELLFLDGAVNTNVSVPSDEWGKYGPTAKTVAPFAEFPSFNLSATNASLDFMTWRGGLQFHNTAKGTVAHGKGMYGNNTGLDRGPMVLFKEMQDQAFPTAVLAPMSNIKLGAQLLRSDDGIWPAKGCEWKPSNQSCHWSHGPSWELTSVPAGFVHRTLLLTGEGIRPTMQAWGDMLLLAHGTKRLRDRSLEYLGVFTDNGAFYDAGYWQPSKGVKDASAVLKSLSVYYAEEKIPVKYLQLDDW
jgi:hypothetical protein